MTLLKDKGARMKKIALLFSGCGNKDGAEITEVVSLLIGLNKHKVKVTAFSLDMDVAVTNHLTKKTQNSEKRNMLTEAARITRGEIQDLNSLVVKDFDALAIAGGFGAALHFSNWAEKGSGCEVHSEVKRVIEEFYQQEKPIAAVCIAPVLLAKVLGSKGITVTLGDDEKVSAEVKKTGAKVQNCPVNDYITDRDHRIITSPAFMYDTTYDQVFDGLQLLAKELVEMA